MVHTGLDLKLDVLYTVIIVLVFPQLVVMAKPTKIKIIFLMQLMFFTALILHICYACAFSKIVSHEKFD